MQGAWGEAAAAVGTKAKSAAQRASGVICCSAAASAADPFTLTPPFNNSVVNYVYTVQAYKHASQLPQISA